MSPVCCEGEGEEKGGEKGRKSLSGAEATKGGKRGGGKREKKREGSPHSVEGFARRRGIGAHREEKRKKKKKRKGRECFNNFLYFFVADVYAILCAWSNPKGRGKEEKKGEKRKKGREKPLTKVHFILTPYSLQHHGEIKKRVEEGRKKGKKGESLCHVLNSEGPMINEIPRVLTRRRKGKKREKKRKEKLLGNPHFRCCGPPTTT